MGFLIVLWKKLTYTKALEQSSGKFETFFFETVYRVTYVTGFSEYDRNIAYLLYSYTLKLLIVLILFCELWHFFTLTSSLDGIMAGFNTFFIQFSAIYKYKNLVRYKQVFKNLAASMESPYFDISTSGRKKLFNEWQQKNEAYVWLVVGLGTGTLAAWHTYPLLDDLDYNLMVPVRLPYEYDSLPLYIPTYIGVLLSFSYIAYFVMVNDIIMQAHIMHLLCQFNVLSDCFKNILRDCCEDMEDMTHNALFMSDEFKQRYIKRIDCLIQQHQIVLNNVLSLRVILNGPMLAQLAVSTTLICSIGYQVATSTENYTKCLMSLLFLGYNMSVLYIICRCGEEVKVQCRYVGEALYCSGWERGMSAVPGVKARLKMIIARANSELVLSAGGMYELSLASYSNMIKTSYSAMTLLLRMRHEQS